MARKKEERGERLNKAGEQGSRASVLALGTGGTVMPGSTGWACLNAVRVCTVLWLEAF